MANTGHKENVRKMMSTTKSDSMYYIDYTCEECGQQGTARFSGEHMTTDADGYAYPTKTIYCCECKADRIIWEDVVCYNETAGDDHDSE